MELDLSSIQSNQNDHRQQQYSASQQQFIINEVGNQIAYNNRMHQLSQQAKEQFRLNDNPNDSDDNFRMNIRQMLNTENCEYSEHTQQNNQIHNIHNQSKQQNPHQFGEPLKGSFLQQMERLGKTLSFQSKVYNVYSPQISIDQQSLNNPIIDILPSLIKKEHLQKNTFFDQIKQIIHETYIIDFSRGKKKSSIKKFNQRACSRQISKNTISSMMSYKKMPQVMGSLKNNKNKSVSKKKKTHIQSNIRKSQNSWCSLAKGYKKVGTNYNSINSYTLQLQTNKNKSKTNGNQVQVNKRKACSKFRL